MRLLSLLVIALAVLAGCADDDAVVPPEEPVLQGSELNVVTAFYPLTYATQMVAGDLLLVEPLMEPDVRPDAVTMGSREQILVDKADLVVSMSDFHAGLDELTADRDNVLNVAPAAGLVPHASLPSTAVPAAETLSDQVDPHFWLDPLRLAEVGDFIAARMAELDPDNADAFEINAQRLHGSLASLDGDYRLDLATCESKNLVTSEPAFGYLAARYGLTQVVVDPAGDPAPISDYVRANAVSTVYIPPSAEPTVVAALTDQVDVTAGVLDPLSAVLPRSPGTGYEDIMRVNLRVLGEGQRCTSLGVPDGSGDSQTDGGSDGGSPGAGS